MAPTRTHRPRRPPRSRGAAPTLVTLCLLGGGLLGLTLPTGCGPEGKAQADAAPPAGCVLGEFDCLTGTECVASSRVCDDTEDCSNGRDEEECGCGPGLYTCGDGQCIHAAFVCDHVVNCNDRSDEQGCP